MLRAFRHRKIFRQIYILSRLRVVSEEVIERGSLILVA
jgi:hypothetical protein